MNFVDESSLMRYQSLSGMKVASWGTKAYLCLELFWEELHYYKCYTIRPEEINHHIPNINNKN